MYRIGFFGDGPWAHNTFDEIQLDKRFLVKFICLRYEKPDNKWDKNAADFIQLVAA